MKPIGILGGGQLARMLVLEAHRLSLPVAVLSPHESDPARIVTGNWVQGDPMKRRDLLRFMSQCSSVTFESEFFNAELIGDVMKETQVPVWPEPRVMGLLQDRLTQKNLFDEHDLPTAPWRPVDSSQDAVVAYVALDGKVVFKKRRGGYDGNGTFVVRNDGELGAFANRGLKDSFIAEKLIKFDREVAIICVRDQAGAVFFFPFVESFQKDSRCLWVRGPIRETRAFIEMKRRLARFLNQIGYVGAMGVELFETSGHLLINEIAPRVHNTGHYTIDAFSLNQFSLHLRAVGGLLMQGFAVPRSKAFAMWNLLGTPEPGKLKPWNARSAVGEKSSAEAVVHWYGKSESRPGRKMGHVNSQAKTTEAAFKLAKSVAARTVKDIGY